MNNFHDESEEFEVEEVEGMMQLEAALLLRTVRMLRLVGLTLSAVVVVLRPEPTTF